MDNYIVAIWWLDSVPMTNYKSFYALEDAQEYANAKADALRKKGFDFDVSIYERTNY